MIFYFPSLKKTLGFVSLLALTSFAYQQKCFAMDIGTTYDSGDKEDEAAAFERILTNGSPEEQRELGYKYRTGEGVTGDVEKAMRLYEAAAHQGDALAQYEFAMMIESRDLDQAITYYKLAFHQGENLVQEQVNVLNYHDLDTSEDYERALACTRTHYERIARDERLLISNLYAGFKLASMCFTNQPPNIPEAINYYESGICIAKKLDSLTQNIRLLQCKGGMGSEKLWEIRIHSEKLENVIYPCYMQAALNLGSVYQSVQDTFPDYSLKAFELFKKVAKGYKEELNALLPLHQSAQLHLYGAYLAKRGVPEDFNLSYFYKNHSFKKNGWLQYHLGLKYLQGYNDGHGYQLPQNALKAFKHLNRAAHFGNADAFNRCQGLRAPSEQRARNVNPDQPRWQYRLGRIYRYLGKFTNTDSFNAESISFLQASADGGYAPASDKLARLYVKRMRENYDDDVEVNKYNQLSVQRMKEAEDKGISHAVSDWSDPELAISLYYKELKTSFVPQKFASLKKFISFVDTQDMDQLPEEEIDLYRDLYSKTRVLTCDMQFKAEQHSVDSCFKQSDDVLVIKKFEPLYQRLQKAGVAIDELGESILDNCNNSGFFVTCIQPTEEFIEYEDCPDPTENKKTECCFQKIDDQWYACMGEDNATIGYKLKSLLYRGRQAELDWICDDLEDELHEIKKQEDLSNNQRAQMDEEFALVGQARQVLTDGYDYLKKLVKVNLGSRNQSFKEENEAFFNQ